MSIQDGTNEKKYATGLAQAIEFHSGGIGKNGALFTGHDYLNRTAQALPYF